MIPFLAFLSFFSLVFTQSHFIPLPPATCPFSGSSNIDFSTVPQAVVLSRCSSDVSCCNPSYIDKLQSETDWMSPILNNYFSDAQPSCREEWENLLCIPCDKDSYVWTESLSSTNYEINLCSDYCNLIYTACSNSSVNGRGLVQNIYSNPEVFCSDLFQGSNIIADVIPSSDISCYDPSVPVCTADDIDYHYSECIDGRRSLIYDWKFNRTCNGGVSLPSSVYNLDCPISCEAGTYLPLGTTQCQQCFAGTFSLGGGHRFQTWERWPTRFLEFTTYCVNNYLVPISSSSCSGWTLNNTFLESHIYGKHNTKSVLKTEVDLLRNGSVSFIMTVDCEYSYDRLSFDIDGVSTWIKNTAVRTELTFPLSPGHHVLMWTYSKDASVNYGYDRSMIYMIEVMGMAENSDYCEDCPAGTTSLNHATECNDCLLNTYTPSSGYFACLDCPTDQFAFPGDTHCTPKLDCTQNDYEPYFTQCSPAHTRSQSYRWIVPHICKESSTSAQLPSDILNLPCAPCNPGQYRQEDECLSCPVGEWSAVGTERQCTPCWEGTYAPKQMSLKRWDDWPAEANTTCNGQCGTSGWRLRGTFIDSGIDHGGHADVSFVIPVTIEAEPYGHLRYTYSLQCDGWCYLELREGTDFIYSSWNQVTIPGQNVSAGPFFLQTGSHNLTWNFGKFFGRRNSDQAIIWEIVIDGVVQGGAGECVPCPVGTASQAQSESCEICSAGSYAEEGSTECTPCPENTYQDLPQQGLCKNCGHNTYTPAGSRECGLNNCTFSPDGLEVYYLEGLAKDIDMYGPVEEPLYPPYYYYLNPCKKQDLSNATCRDEDGVPINTYACQYSLVDNYAVDLGHVMGFYPYGGPEKGLILSFTEGDPGCGNSLLNQTDVPRSLNVTLVCDPLAGVGTPQRDGMIYIGTQYPDVCIFHLKWRSVYGCPGCTQDDWKLLTGACQDGQQTIRHVWKTNPPSCHGGLSLPPPYLINCTSVISCPPGTHLTAEDVCVPCPPGQYSLGDGESVPTNFSGSLDPPFTTGCSGTQCVPWSSQDGVLVSGVNGMSWLELNTIFKSGVEDSIEFEYRYEAQGEPFLFYIDGKLIPLENVEKLIRELGYKWFKTSVSLGKHVFRWEYTHGPRNFTGQKDNSVSLRRLNLRGTTIAVASCTPCPEGMVSDDNKAGCHECPSNYFLSDNQCEHCPVTQYRFLGQPTCNEAVPCTMDDFIELYPSDLSSVRCGSGNAVSFKTTYVRKLISSYCEGGPEMSGRDITTCIPCPKGTRYDIEAQKCLPCPTGTFLKGDACVAADAGYGVQKMLYFFTTGDVLDTFLVATRDCWGCDNGDGWRVFGSFAYSGLYAGDAAASLELTVVTADDYFVPTVTFTITLKDSPIQQKNKKKNSDTDGSQSGVEFYIDDIIQDFPFQISVNEPISRTYVIGGKKGDPHKIKWVYMQSGDEPYRFITLSDVEITSTAEGGAVEQTPCPGGTYYNSIKMQCILCDPGSYSEPGASSCTLCPPGSVSKEGALVCTKCGTGTISTKNVCKSTCTFINDASKYNYDLTPLKDSIYSVSPTLYDRTSTIYQINICSKFAPENCFTSECKEVGYVFGSFADNYMYQSLPFTMGTELEFVAKEQSNQYEENPLSNPNTFDLVYTQGTNLPPGCESVKTTIHFLCDLEMGRGEPEIKEFMDKCSTVFQWRSVYACHQCLESDQDQTKGACINGQRVISYFYKEPCNGVTKASTTEKCADIYLGRNVTITVVAAIMSAVLLGLLVAFYFFHQKRNLEAKYQRLKNDANVEDSDDEPMALPIQKDEAVDLEDDEIGSVNGNLADPTE